MVFPLSECCVFMSSGSEDTLLRSRGPILVWMSGNLISLPLCTVSVRSHQMAGLVVGNLLETDMQGFREVHVRVCVLITFVLCMN